jgi:hypothetical protein
LRWTWPGAGCLLIEAGTLLALALPAMGMLSRAMRRTK